MMIQDVLWHPSDRAFTDSHIARFALNRGLSPHDYEHLHRWSVAHPDRFWSALWDYVGVLGEKGCTVYVPSDGNPMTGARFFTDAQLNIAENLLRGNDDDLAVVAAVESGVCSRVSRGRLREEVARCAAGLRGLGVTAGDRVAGILPNSVEALVALLATASLGAIWSSCSPDFGEQAILGRLGLIGPKVLFAAPAYRYDGKAHDISERLAGIARRMPRLDAMVRCGELQDRRLGIDQVELAFESCGQIAPFDPVPMPFDAPLYIVYTSGTTGKPKAIVHSAGGVLLQHLKEHMLHGDVQRGSVLGWYTNTAWMMYHWMVSALGCGAAIVLMDGSATPTTDTGPNLGFLWRIAEDAGITHFGTSPKYLATLQQSDYRPNRHHDLSQLRSVLSAGAPVSPRQFDWVYQSIKSDMVFSSISGGTEILGCFFLGAPILPVRCGELTCKALGMAVTVMDDRNAPLLGRRGDLVCTEPFPSMPLTFWGDGGHERYLNTYFRDRREIWTHGDIAELTDHGGAIIHGRSDSTLKPGGVRIGASDIYAVCEGMEIVEDCLVFGLPTDGDEEIILCMKLRNGYSLDADAEQWIRSAIRTETSPRHVPHRIVSVADIPYTLNGKRAESAARAAAQGFPVPNLSSLRNPECLDGFRPAVFGT